MELLAKGKERNQELMKLSELQYKAQEVAQYQEVSKLSINTLLHTCVHVFPTGWEVQGCSDKI